MAGFGWNPPSKHRPMNRRIWTIAVVGVLGCTKPPAEPAGLRVALITPGSIADAAWNAGAFEGLQQLKDSLGAEISHQPVNSQCPSTSPA